MTLSYEDVVLTTLFFLCYIIPPSAGVFLIVILASGHFPPFCVSFNYSLFVLHDDTSVLFFICTIAIILYTLPPPSNRSSPFLLLSRA